MGCSNVLLKKMKKGLVYYENFLTYLNLKMMRYIFKQIPFFYYYFRGTLSFKPGAAHPFFLKRVVFTKHEEVRPCHEHDAVIEQTVRRVDTAKSDKPCPLLSC